ncbi:serine hydrolase domain-containing protein [Tunturibacter psychrotolerans]|uniref:Serine hydrolase domain-containing protein n=1 Tax=Tunturiibacter psychrotolerans TaxID=3069686 RepID=A0AAU7ZK53_9BACT
MSSVPAHARPSFEPVRNLILRAIAQGKATGVAVAVAHGGSIVWEQGFGWANREARLKATAHTPFTLASITKPFTATTLMALVAEGKLSLDDSANKYLTNSRIQGTNGNADTATVRLLGAHVSGLPTMYEGYDRGEANLALDADALISNYGRLAYSPRSCYEYSNIGFAALAVVASNLTGTDFGALMTQRVLTPLGLHDSFFNTSVARLRTGAARYDSLGNLIPYYTTSTPASGELYASAHDLARFAMFNMKNHVPGQAPFLDDHCVDELHKPVFVGPSGVATTFGWFTGHLKSGIPVIFKIGGQPGVATGLYMLPSENLACMVLTNRSDGRELCSEVCNQVLAGYLPEWQQPEETSGPPTSPFVVRPSFGGHWRGTLANDGAKMQAELNIDSSDLATLSLGDKPAARITGMQSEGVALTGVSVGLIDSPDSLRTGAKTLKIKLLPQEGKLVGRVIAVAGDPNVKNVMLPYVLTLNQIPR